MVMVTGGEEIPDVHNIKSNYGMASSKLVVLFVLMVGLIGSRAARRTFFILGIGNLEHLGTCDDSIPLAGGSEVLQDDSNDPITANTILLRSWILLLYLS
ncbi:hypothetical protein IFM89_002929 [Coptis chinensis]|uniref:Uncharacterized protein n=1 Tax=Coptis chinensis TaxID=261450 RepID=A0A835IKP3_9MAGN|nr:hypothetical protein IFM89_002929 [Coptis chinensis]